MESIKDLISANPNGLMELKPAISFQEHVDDYGFKLRHVFTIFKSRRIIWNSDADWFAFPNKTLDNLFKVQKESTGDLITVYIVETLRAGKVYCHVVLSDEAYQNILADTNQKVIQVHQMYRKFFKDQLAANMMAN